MKRHQESIEERKGAQEQASINNASQQITVPL